MRSRSFITILEICQGGVNLTNIKCFFMIMEGGDCNAGQLGEQASVRRGGQAGIQPYLKMSC